MVGRGEWPWLPGRPSRKGKQGLLKSSRHAGSGLTGEHGPLPGPSRTLAGSPSLLCGSDPFLVVLAKLCQQKGKEGGKGAEAHSGFRIPFHTAVGGTNCVWHMAITFPSSVPQMYPCASYSQFPNIAFSLLTFVHVELLWENIQYHASSMVHIIPHSSLSLQPWYLDT